MLAEIENNNKEPEKEKTKDIRKDIEKLYKELEQ